LAGRKQYQVETVLDQCYEPENILYKVPADDGNLYILRQQTSIPDRQWEADFVSRGRIRAEAPELASAPLPHPPSVQRKIESADKYTGNRQNGHGDVGINKHVQVMEQKPSLVRLDTSLAFEPVLKQRQRAWPRKQLRKNSPEQ
jgi:hypothetical protein